MVSMLVQGWKDLEQLLDFILGSFLTITITISGLGGGTQLKQG